MHATAGRSKYQVVNNHLVINITVLLNLFYITNFLTNSGTILGTKDTAVTKTMLLPSQKDSIQCISFAFPCRLLLHSSPSIPMFCPHHIQSYMAEHKTQVGQNLEAPGPKLGCPIQIKCIPQM